MKPKPHLPPSPVDEGKVTVTAIETLQPLDIFPGLLLVRVHTDAGVIGHGETYYCAEAVQAMIHDWMARRLLGEDALAIEDAGCFMLEFEAVPGQIAALISAQLDIPTIGIGAGAGTDGQILLCYDLLGVFTDFKPKFTKRYANLTEVAVAGLSQYVQEVKEGVFPDEDHTYGCDQGELEKFATLVERRKQV